MGKMCSKMKSEFKTILKCVGPKNLLTLVLFELSCLAFALLLNITSVSSVSEENNSGSYPGVLIAS